MEEYIRCSCGASALNFEGETHEYMLSVPGCWAMFGEVLEKEYSDFGYARTHHLTVDSYACQHPGKPTPQAISSIGVHLTSLYMVVERGLPLPEAARFKQEISKYSKSTPLFVWLEPPRSFGELTIEQLWEAKTPEQHAEIAQKWATSVWAAWSQHHATVRTWAAQIDFTY